MYGMQTDLIFWSAL